MRRFQLTRVIPVAVGVIVLANAAYAAPPAASSRSSPQRPSPQQVTDDTSTAAYERGVALAVEKRFLEAQAEFERSLSGKPPLDAYFGLGQVELALGRPCSAVDAYSKYLEVGGGSVSDDKRRSVQAHIQQLRQAGASEELCRPAAQSALLYLECNDPEVSVQLDGQESGPLGTGPLKVAAGEHQVEFVSEQYSWPATRFEVSAGSAVHLSCPTSKQGVSAGSVSPPGESGSDSKMSSGKIVALSITGAGLGVAVAALSHFLWNHGRYQVWKEDHALLLDEGGSATAVAQHNDLEDSIDKASKVTVGLAVAGGVLTGVGVTLLLLQPSSKSRAQGASAFHSQVAVHVGGPSAGLSWEGVW